MLQKPDVMKPLRYLHYQPGLRIAVCVECGFAIRSQNIRGHLREQHKLQLSKETVQASLSGLSFVALAEPVTPQMGRIPPFPWLKKPILGHSCILCNYCSLTLSTLSSHYLRNHPGERNGQKTKDLRRPAFVQRFFSANTSSTYFQVDPLLQDLPQDGHFSKFYQSLSAGWQNGDFIGSTASADAQQVEFDLPPFLAKTRWLDAVNGFSTKKLREIVSLPGPSEPEYLHIIRGLGKDFLGSMKTLNGVRPTVLEYLTKWRPSQ